jgi:CBS domain containing-hemolysin-like protein
MFVAWAIIALLILLTGLYVAAEFGAVSARRSRLRRLAEDGNLLAARILPVLEDARALDRYIAASQIGITLSSLILGAYGQATLAPRLEPLLERFDGMQPATVKSVAAGIVLTCLTALAVILGELVPKSLALQNPTRTALVTVLPMQWSMRVFSWSINFLNGSAILLLKALRIPSTGHRHVHSPEEIALLIAESRDGGLLEPEEQVRLHRALRLGLRSARQLMVPRARLAATDASLPFEDVLRIVAASPYSRLPVYRGSIDNIIGILHTKDVVMRYVQASGLTVSSLLRPIVRVPDTMAADHLLTFLRERRSHQALVVDANDSVVGLITLEDVVAELLGGVSDEFKSMQSRPIRLADGRLRLPGSMRLDQAARLIGSAWRSLDRTVAEQITTVLGRIPEPGEEVDVDGVHVEVEALDGDAITSVIVGDRLKQDEGAEA